METNENSRSPFVEASRLLNDKNAPRQLCHYWRNYMDPNLSHVPLSDEEKQFIETWISENEGKIKWITLRKELKVKHGLLRSENALKNYYYSKQRSGKSHTETSEGYPTFDDDPKLVEDDQQIRKQNFYSELQKAETDRNSLATPAETDIFSDSVSQQRNLHSISPSPDSQRDRTDHNSPAISDGTDVTSVSACHAYQQQSLSYNCYNYAHQRSEKSQTEALTTFDDDLKLVEDNQKIRGSKQSKLQRAGTDYNSPPAEIDIFSDSTPQQQNLHSISSSPDSQRDITDRNSPAISDRNTIEPPIYSFPPDTIEPPIYSFPPDTIEPPIYSFPPDGQRAGANSYPPDFLQPRFDGPYPNLPFSI